MCKGIEELMEDSRQEGRQRRGEKKERLPAHSRKAKETACALAGMGLPKEQIASAVGIKSGSRERMDFELRRDWLADKQQRCSTGRAKGRERRYQAENTWPDFTRKIDLSR